MSSTSPPRANQQTPHTSHQFRKRASQACQQCRSRKVKCVLAEKGVPCHNCEVDGTECTILVSRRSRRYRLEKRQQSEGPGSQPSLLPRSTLRSCALPISSTTAPSLPKIPESQTARSYIHKSPQSQSDVHTTFVLTPPTTINTLPPVSSTYGSTPGISPSPELPAYIRAPSREVEPEDLQYLRQRGALAIPEPALRDQLLLAFVLYAYPTLPVVDLQDFVNAIEGRPGCDVSLILFQAVMFAGTAFVDVQLLLDAGFEDRTAARAFFFRKVKLLYDFEWEVDRIILIQATLLHSWWYVSTNDQKDPWHWLGICLALATGIGLNNTGVHATKDAQVRRLWRRIWWTIVSRDRLTAIVTRRPMRIVETDLSLPALKFQDFDTRPIDSALPLLRDCSLINDSTSRVMLADIFMSQLKILLISGRIIANLYNLQGFVASSSEWAMWYTPRERSHLDAQLIDQMQAELQDWSDNLNNYCRMDYHTGGDADELQEKVLRTHAAGLKMLHLLAQEAFHRPLACEAEGLSGTKARSSISQAASQMSDVALTLRNENLLRYVPPLSVGCILTAIVSFFVDIRVARKLPTDFPEHQYHDCIRSLFSLREIWPITKGTCQMVSQMENNQIWYARSLKMLAPPAPTGDESGNGRKSGAHNVESRTPRLHSRPNPVNSSSHPDAEGGRALEVDHNGISTPDIFTSTYLATRYPFSWTAADFDIFGPSSCRELFMDPEMNAFDLDGSLSAGMS